MKMKEKLKRTSEKMGGNSEGKNERKTNEETSRENMRENEFIFKSILKDADIKSTIVDLDFNKYKNQIKETNEENKKVIYEPVKLEQNYRNFDYESPWEGTKYIKKESEK